MEHTVYQKKSDNEISYCDQVYDRVKTNCFPRKKHLTKRLKDEKTVC